MLISKRKLGLILLLALGASMILGAGCSLYTDDEQPGIYYEFKDFEVLPLGKNITDMLMDPAQPYLYLADYGNNQLLRISVDGAMRVDKKLPIGSHPVALDLMPDQSTIAVGLNGESRVKMVDLQSFSVTQSIPVSLTEVNDIVCAGDTTIFVSSPGEQTLVSVSTLSHYERDHTVRSGELLALPEQKKLFVANENYVLKYDVSSGFGVREAFSSTFSFKVKVNDFTFSPDRSLVFLCFANPVDHTRVKDVLAFNTSDLTLAGKYEVKSAGMGVAVSRDGSRVFVAPTDADGAGVFVVEFDGETKLEKNYYMAAGNLKEKGIALGNNEKYLYIIVFSPGDDDSFEPYNNNSYDLQRIEVTP